MGLNLTYFEGQTPLDEEEKEGLLISTIATRGELDEFEQQGIEQAIQWTMGQSFKPEVIFTENFMCTLHKRMFVDVWAWAGNYRITNKNIGINYWDIRIALKCLLDDASYWHTNKTYPPDEIALRFKHRLVCIHCFPNGNGRHSRLMADILIEKIYKRPVFSWGSDHGTNDLNIRNTYLKALQVADSGDYSLLLNFARN